mmetsp:Transcript_63207/g.159990  ORF Transcript_63207/g.159990 Transcript_63207/m.159990 type:complete len:317 (-) Transcript_63207:1613-2563(-)
MCAAPSMIIRVRIAIDGSDWLPAPVHRRLRRAHLCQVNPSGDDGAWSWCGRGHRHTPSHLRPTDVLVEEANIGDLACESFTDPEFVARGALSSREPIKPLTNQRAILVNKHLASLGDRTQVVAFPVSHSPLSSTYIAVVAVAPCHLENQLVARALVVDLNLARFTFDVEGHSVVAAAVPLRSEGDRKCPRDIGIGVVAHVLHVKGVACKGAPCPRELRIQLRVGKALCERGPRSEGGGPVADRAMEELEVLDHSVKILIPSPIRAADVAVDTSGTARSQDPVDPLADELRVPVNKHLAMPSNSDEPLVLLAYSDRM